MISSTAPPAPFKLSINDSYHLTWIAPSQKNGLIRAYQLTLLNMKTRTYILQKDIPSARSQYQIEIDLDPYTTYNVSLQAVTVKAGPPALVSFTTPEGGRSCCCCYRIFPTTTMTSHAVNTAQRVYNATPGFSIVCQFQ